MDFLRFGAGIVGAVANRIIPMRQGEESGPTTDGGLFTPTTSSSRAPGCYRDISPTQMAELRNVMPLIRKDGVLEALGHGQLATTDERNALYRAVVFVYGFFEHRGKNWGDFRWDEENNKYILERASFGRYGDIPSPSTAEGRIKIAKAMTDTRKNPERIQRLLRLASVEEDDDLLKNDTNKLLFEMFLRLNIRFFSKEKVTGFMPNVLKKVYFTFKIQLHRNCWFINGTDFLDFQIWRDFDLPDEQMRLSIDKSQLSRRYMTPEILFDYVVNDNGGHACEFLAKVFAKKEKDLFFKFTSNDPFYEWNNCLKQILDRHGPAYVAYSSKNLDVFASTYRYTLDQGIPCFDSLEGAPTKYICTDKPENEEELLQEQLSGTRGYRSADEVPGLVHMASSSLSCSSSPNSKGLEISYGNVDEDEEYTQDGKQGILQKLSCNLVGAGKEKTRDRSASEVSLMSLGYAAAASSEPVEDPRFAKRHAGVCIGYISDEDGKIWYLFKNSWPEVPLFCMSLECYRETYPITTCFQTKLTHMPVATEVFNEKRFAATHSPIASGEGPRDRYADIDDGFRRYY
jgi:hypothetical protein